MINILIIGASNINPNFEICKCPVFCQNSYHIHCQSQGVNLKISSAPGARFNHSIKNPSNLIAEALSPNFYPDFIIVYSDIALNSFEQHNNYEGCSVTFCKNELLRLTYISKTVKFLVHLSQPRSTTPNNFNWDFNWQIYHKAKFIPNLHQKFIKNSLSQNKPSKKFHNVLFLHLTPEAVAKNLQNLINTAVRI